MDTLYYNGIVHTMDPDDPLVSAVWIRGDRIFRTGSGDRLLADFPSGGLTVDLKGSAVYPGMTDTHLHILNYAVTSSQLVLNDVRDRSVLFDMLRACAGSREKGDRIVGRGFNEDLWKDNRLPTRAELDAVCPNHPVKLVRVCGHLAVCNSLALAESHIDENTPVPFGGHVDLEHGFFAENGLVLLSSDDCVDTVENCMEYLYAGMSRAADAGLTSIFSDDFGSGGFSMPTVAEAYRALEKAGRMPVRVVQQCAMPSSAEFNDFLKRGYRYGQGGAFYRFGPRKLYADGSLGARTAHLLRPYEGTDSRGVSVYRQEELNALAAESHREGMPFIIHAIGDGAIENVLTAIRYARREVPGTDGLPDGIVHCQITTPEQLKAIADEHIMVYAQPVFTEYDLHICRARVGARRESTSYNWRTMYDAGVTISSGSDCPVEPLDPVKNIYCAVTRKDFDGYPEKGWMPDQRLTPEQAVACHTVNAAAQAGLSGDFGRIRKGYLADLSVFDRDFCLHNEEDLLAVKPLFTVVNGVRRDCR